jgi:hypothetical protein
MAEPGPVRRGAAPLPQALALAPLLRGVAGLSLALEAEDPVIDGLAAHLSGACEALHALVPGDLAPRMTAGGMTAGTAEETGGRVYLDHSHDIGAYNPCFPEYEISVSGDCATGTVAFPLAFEGPPGMVHGGVLSLFFDLIVQHHNCELGIAGKTTTMTVSYLRPVPLLESLEFEVRRSDQDQPGERPRTTSQARVFRGDRAYCSATVEAVAGDVSRLPGVSPRGSAP